MFLSVGQFASDFQSPNGAEKSEMRNCTKKINGIANGSEGLMTFSRAFHWSL